MITICVLLPFFLGGCGNSYPAGNSESIVHSVKVAACGDVLFYDSNYSHFPENGSVADFYAVARPVAASVGAADVALINQEVPTAGRSWGISGYPFFNAPFELVEALKKIGFDVFCTANNHSLDKGIAGIQSSIGYYRKTGTLYVGTADEGESPLLPLVLLVNEIKIAIFSLTDISNVPYPHPSPVGNTDDPALLESLIALAAKECDFVIIMLHYGEEYHQEPRPCDRDLFLSLINAGADVIFGNHAHVIRPFEIISAANGRKAFVFWGLGNFIGWMNHSPECSVGGIFTVELQLLLHADGQAEYRILNPSVELTYSVNRGKVHKTVFLRDAASFSDNAEDLFDNAAACLRQFGFDVNVF